jgi:flagellar hook-associated protein 2
MAIASTTGLGSGIEISNLVSQLVAAEGQASTTQLDRRETSAKDHLTALGTLKGALSAFQTAASKLKDSNSLRSSTATSSSEDILTATAGASTVAGSYAVQVMSLAQSQTLVSGGQGFASATDTVGTGSLTIKVGSSQIDLNITSSNNTLVGIRDAINRSPQNEGLVSASIINVDNGAGGTESRLVLSAVQTGTANRLTLTAVDDDGNNTDTNGLSRLVYDPNGSGVANMAEKTAAKDAVINVAGYDVTRSSNTITDVIDGVTLDLKSAKPGTTVNVNIASDKSAVSKTIQDFVDAYNKLNTVIGDLTKYDSTGKNSGPLLGNSTLRGIQNTIRRELGNSVSSAANSSYSTLFSIGVEIDRLGKMSINQSRMDDALKNNPKALEDVFASSNGIAVRLDNTLDLYLQTGGILDGQTKSLSSTLQSIGKDRLDLQDRMAKLQDTLLKQFNAMDSMVGQLKATGSYLTQQLSALSS